MVVWTPDGEQCIRAATLIWTASVRASHLGRALEAATGCSIDRGGRVVVESDFSIASYPEIRIAGDLWRYSHTKDGKPLTSKRRLPNRRAALLARTLQRWWTVVHAQNFNI